MPTKPVAELRKTLSRIVGHLQSVHDQKRGLVGRNQVARTRRLNAQPSSPSYDRRPASRDLAAKTWTIIDEMRGQLLPYLRDSQIFGIGVVRGEDDMPFVYGHALLLVQPVSYPRHGRMKYGCRQALGVKRLVVSLTAPHEVCRRDLSAPSSCLECSAAHLFSGCVPRRTAALARSR